MVSDLIGMAFLAIVVIALLRFVPRPASRTWAVGLLIFAVISNLSTLIVTIVAYYSPPSVYLDTEKNQLEFNRGEKGEVFGVRVNNPPEECRVTDKNRPLALAAGNLALAAVALVFLLRTATLVTKPDVKETSRGGAA
jgi:hypothetical protein